jgi:repressor of nif and glnA expression
MNEILYKLCRHCVSIMDGWHPYSSTCISKSTNISIGKVRYQLKKLKEDGLIERFSEGGQTEEGKVFCIHGFGITDKAIETKEYKKAFEEEKELCKKCFDIDI